MMMLFGCCMRIATVTELLEHARPPRLFDIIRKNNYKQLLIDLPFVNKKKGKGYGNRKYYGIAFFFLL